MAVGDASHTSANTTFFPKPPLLFSHGPAEARNDNMPKRKLASVRYHTTTMLTTEPPRLGKGEVYKTSVEKQ